MSRIQHVVEPQSASRLLHESGVPLLVEGAAANLYQTWDADRALFPYSIRLRSDGSMMRDYDHPLSVRYTINSLLGLHRYEVVTPGRGNAEAMEWTRSFLDRNRTRITSLADWGLLTVLQVELGDTRGAAASLESVQLLSTQRAHTVQDVAWALWGACAGARLEVPAAEAVAHQLADTLLVRYRDPVSGMPLHSPARWRRRVVSFGALVYYLRALWETSLSLHREDAEQAFERGLERAFDIQRQDGGWPWLMDTATGRAVDDYPLFAVHQDSMAMLFLLPSLDAGDACAASAISRSLAWTRGNNVLGAEMYASEPFFLAYRSIERTERLPRLRRFVRSSVRARLGSGSGSGSGNEAQMRQLVLNDECRSYHPGWILFAWADRLST